MTAYTVEQSKMNRGKIHIVDAKAINEKVIVAPVRMVRRVSKTCRNCTYKFSGAPRVVNIGGFERIDNKIRSKKNWCLFKGKDFRGNTCEQWEPKHPHYVPKQ